MRFRQRVAVEAPVKTRTPAGQEIDNGYDVVTGMESVPANVQVATEERRGERFVVTEDMYSIDLGGHFPDLTTGMVILDGEAVYDVLRVLPTLRRELTSVVAERVAL